MRTTFFAVSWTCLAAVWLPSRLPAQALGCTGQELSRTRLIVDGGRELYVEPSVLAVSGSRSLLAGKPSYLFLKRDAGETAELESRNTVFGVVLDADGSARVVPAPPVPGSLLAAVAGIGTGSERWRVIFAEVDSIGVGDTRVAAFWHGVYDGRRWSSLERLPQPPGKALQYLNTSPVAENADTVVWAALTTLEEHQQSVVVFERRGGVWSHELVATPFASGVEAIHAPTIGFALAIRHTDAEPAHGQSDFLYTRQSGWTLQRRLATVATDGSALVSPRPVERLSEGRDSTKMTLGFTTPMPTTLGNREEPLIAVARVLGESFSRVLLGNGSILWATEHTDSSGVRELRLVQPMPDSTVTVWRAPNPYRGGFTAAGFSSSDVLIVGPELNETHGVLVSLILRIRIACSRE